MSKFRAFSKTLKMITSKCGLCFLGTVEKKVIDVILKLATVGLCARALNLLYPSSFNRIGSRRFWGSQTEQGGPHGSLLLGERTVSALAWLHHFLTLYAALYNPVSALLGKNTVSFGCLYKY